MSLLLGRAARLRCSPPFSSLLCPKPRLIGTQHSVKFSSAKASGDPRAGSESVWGLKENNPDYWEGYLSTRPVYGDKLQQHLRVPRRPCRVIASLVLNCPRRGCRAGPGISPARSQVLPCCRERPQREPSRVSTGEELAAKFPPASADLVVCPLMFPLMDCNAALTSFQSLLKPNGTLAIWFYSRVHFSEPEYAQTCQPLLDRIINHHYGREIQGNGPEHSAKWKPVADQIASWLDNVPFAEAEWHSVERWKWNRSWTDMGFFTQGACDFKVEPTSCVGEKEKVIEIEDRNFWRKDWDVPPASQQDSRNLLARRPSSSCAAAGVE
ncbi:hypothetical protein TEQG_06692 [Trichophyton equinum CBS 127.97]|uniref:Methyltransferase type 11 domain-containing protein n=1 Tax=Trichophyton equinum (strain ATCC MYA-4606 / CBS 127.97) TaxID=559882 RepID=F2Q0P1_TRIEC|nr:hypothetical protein TEQG_06692 [Trichophyton equinum CBS 127.97]